MKYTKRIQQGLIKIVYAELVELHLLDKVSVFIKFPKTPGQIIHTCPEGKNVGILLQHEDIYSNLNIHVHGIFQELPDENVLIRVTDTWKPTFYDVLFGLLHELRHLYQFINSQEDDFFSSSARYSYDCDPLELDANEYAQTRIKNTYNFVYRQKLCSMLY